MGTFYLTLLSVFILLSATSAFLLNYLQEFEAKKFPEEMVPEKFVQARKDVFHIDCLRALEAIIFEPSEFEKILFKNTSRILRGNRTKKGHISGFYFDTLIKAYHVRVIADERVPHWVELAATLEKAEKKADTYFTAVELVKGAKSNCVLGDEWKDGSFLTKLGKSVEKNAGLSQLGCFERETFQAAQMENYTVETMKAWREALLLFSFSMGVAFNFEEYHVNGRKPPLPRRSTLGVMASDAKRLEIEIHANQQEFSERLASAKIVGDPTDIKYYQDCISHFDKTIRQFPYDWLLESGRNPNLTRDRRRAYFRGVKATAFADEYYDDYVANYSTDLRTFEEAVLSKKVKHDTWYLALRFFAIQLNLFAQDPGKKEGIYRDTETTEYWFELKKPLQNARVAQDRLDYLNERMKCYLGKNYWQDVRNGTLAKMQEQFQTKYIFSKISKTLYQPCKPNDTDLISECSVENHEMCVPAMLSREQQRHIDVQEDKTYYKPKWVFWRDDNEPKFERKCRGEITYVIPVFLCRCGVRQDCGSDVGEDINCVLQENDELRKQCLGSVGYPCKSLPLAPGRHDEICVTGYCDMGQNMCGHDDRSWEQAK